ncbi:hypothetical protein JCM11641_003904 [Rhodosporidiobolus odoratus]
MRAVSPLPATMTLGDLDPLVKPGIVPAGSWTILLIRFGEDATVMDILAALSGLEREGEEVDEVEDKEEGEKTDQPESSFSKPRFGVGAVKNCRRTPLRG